MKKLVKKFWVPAGVLLLGVALAQRGDSSGYALIGMALGATVARLGR